MMLARTLKNFAKRFMRYLGILISRRLVISNFTEFCSTKPLRRALVSYLVLPLLPPSPWRDHVMFSNKGIAQCLPEVLNKMGYSVDIINYDNTTWRPRRKYDLLIGHGGINFERIARLFGNGTRKIYFSTGIYWRKWNLNEAKRIYNLTDRRGHLLGRSRSILANEEYANQSADGIICLGNANSANSYSQFPHVVAINNATYPLEWDGWKKKDYAAGRSHFLFFSGRGNLHKGLDVLLEAFIQTPLHLHVCQWIEPEFAKVYQSELYNYANIHLHGFVSMRSPAFESLALQCNWIILPTCAEGQPGSVIECMAYGLVPVVPEEANIDLADWGIRLKEVTVEHLVDTTTYLSQMAVQDCETRSLKTLDVVRSSYMPSHFKTRLTRAIEEILATGEEAEGAALAGSSTHVNPPTEASA